MKEEGREMLRSQLTLPGLNRSCGFSMVEILVTSAIFLVIVGGLYLTVNMTYVPASITGTKLELQQEVRRATEMMVRDIRQTSRVKFNVTDTTTGDEMFFANVSASNGTFSAPIRFYQCLGYNATAADHRNWTTTVIEYIVDSVNGTIIRRDYETNQTLSFRNIDNLTFTKTSQNQFNVNITASAQARGSIVPAVSLETEVKLRNE